MARLFIKTAGLENRTLELCLGVNRVGRDPDCDFPIDHPTVSTIHCEMVVSADGVLLRDCESTNGTYINGDEIREAWLMPGQEIKLGKVELFVENTDVKVAIPKFSRDRPKPPSMTADGGMLCPRHANAQVTYKCTNCSEVMCNSCVRVMRIKGGQPLYLCPVCSHKCEPIQFLPTKQKKRVLRKLLDTVKLKFTFAGRSKTKK